MTMRPGLFLVPFLAGCVADVPPKQREPASVRPVKVIPAADGSFTDTDANKYRDSSAVVLYVMGDAPGYHLPIRATGEFQVRLEDPRGRTIAEWRFDKAQTANALRNLPPGPGFVFELDLRKSGTRLGSDVLEESEADLVVTFVPESGDPIKARTSAPILIGPVARGDR